MTTDYSPRIDSVRPRAATAESSIRVRVLADELVARMLECGHAARWRQRWRLGYR